MPEEGVKTSLASRMLVRDIKPGMRGINLEGTVVSKSASYEISTRYGPAVVCEAEIEDSTGKIAWRLWRAQSQLVKLGDKALIENAFVRTYLGKLEVNLGSDGRIVLIKT